MTVRVGLPDGSGDSASYRTRNGAWAPVAIDVTSIEACPANRYRLLLTSSDGEDMTYHYVVPIPALEAKTKAVVFGYLKPGNLSSDFSAILQTANGEPIPEAVRTTVVRTGAQDILEPHDYLLLQLGGRLPGLKAALSPPVDAKNAPKGQQARVNAPDDEQPQRNVSVAERLDQLPDRWFGYDAVDVVFLSTGNKEFIADLLADQTGRREALTEWVQRGGRLVLAAGRNRDLLKRDKLAFLPCKLEGIVRRSSLSLDPWLPGDLTSRMRQVDLTILKPAPGVEVLVTTNATNEDNTVRPVVVQAPFGLGRVILVAFDLDSGPFVDAGFREGQAIFWNKLLAELSVKPGGPEVRSSTPPLELGDALSRGIEEFDEVPTVSFGWVAVLILVYIVLVGPLDYFVLRKIFKRLELTWITFPLIVLLVSFCAYWTAYSTKGNALRVNKVDLVEVDLRGRQVFGSSWFTLFSPRIQDYSVTVEPVSPVWSTEQVGTTTVLSTLDPPMRASRQGSQALMRRPYFYAENATGLRDVAVPVWATRSFTASWRAAIDSLKPPIGATLSRRDAATSPMGSIVNNLPVALRDVVLIHDDKTYPLKDILPPGDPLLHPGVTWRVDELFNEQFRKPIPLKSWLNEVAPAVGKPVTLSPVQTLRLAMFHDGADTERWRASGLRSLDQQWRIHPLGDTKLSRDTVILVARHSAAERPLRRAKTTRLQGRCPNRR